MPGYPSVGRDYAKEQYCIVPAEIDVSYTLVRFRHESQGFGVGVNCHQQACVPAGARVCLTGIDKATQELFSVKAVELVEMIELTEREIGLLKIVFKGVQIKHRDGVQFSNGCRVSLELLNSGLTAKVTLMARRELVEA